jgi:hypothetical protein
VIAVGEAAFALFLHAEGDGVAGLVDGRTCRGAGGEQEDDRREE